MAGMQAHRPQSQLELDIKRQDRKFYDSILEDAINNHKLRADNIERASPSLGALGGFTALFATPFKSQQVLRTVHSAS